MKHINHFALTILLLGLTLLTACAPKQTTTVLIYMVGSDLETKDGYATMDLREMLDAQLSDSVNVVLQTGGAWEWQNEWMTDGATERFLLADGAFHPVEMLPSTVLMSQPDTLADFIRWGTGRYPADRYMLVLWNHGGGTSGGFGEDEIASGDTLMLHELRAALEKAGVKFDMIGFDACLMNTMSNAYMLSSFADYLIAPEDIGAPKGWKYDTFLTALAENPKTTMPELAETIAEDYVADARKAGNGYANMALVDLSAMTAVADGWRTLAGQLYDRLNTGGYGELEAALLETKAFGFLNSADQYDMVDLLERLQTANIVDTYELRELVRKAVVFVKSAQEVEGVNGLSIYLPYKTYFDYSVYDVRDALFGCGFSEQDIMFLDLFAQLRSETIH